MHLSVRLATICRIALALGAWLILPHHLAAANPPVIQLLAETQQSSLVEKQLLVSTDAGTFTSLDVTVSFNAAGSVPTVTLLAGASGASFSTNSSTPGVLAIALANSTAMPNGAILALRYPGTANPTVQGPVRLLTGQVDEAASLLITDPVQPCHILTAAFGRPDHPAIQTLWAAHHRLLPGQAWDAPWHQAYLRWYDRQGPNAAAIVRQHPLLRALVRLATRPAAAWARSNMRVK